METDVRRVPARAGRSGRASRSCRSIRSHDYDEYVDGKPRADGIRVVPRLPRHHAARGRRRRPAGRGDRARPRQPQERARAAADPARTGCEAYPGSVALRAGGPGRRAAPRRRVVQRELPATCWSRPGIADLFEARVDGVVAARAAPARQARAGHVPGRGARARRSSRPQAAVFEDALAGVAAGRAGGFGFVVGVDRVGQADALRQHGADIVVTDLAELLDEPMIIQDSAFTVEPWSLRETHLDLDLLAQTESVFALSNGHIGWRGNLDEGEPHGLPGTYLNGFYELRPLPLRRGRLRASRVRPDGHQRHQRQADPAARRRRAVRRPLRRAALARAGARPPRRACWIAGPSGCRPPGRAVRVTSTRLVSFTQRAIAAICYEVEPLDGPAGSRCSPSCWPTSSCRTASQDPRVAAVLENPLASEWKSAAAEHRGAGAQDQAQRAARRRRRWTT